MSLHARTVASFPSASLPSRSGGLPIEIALIAQLGHGAGDQLVTSAMLRQREHAEFVDALDEPSARLAGTHFDQGDATSLYSFAVGAKGHPFHRHAGHRVFTAISGSAGVQLRFSDATPEQLTDDPASFLRGLRHVDVPPDCLFSVRFGGETWHQFASPRPGRRHPALLALSCHTDELGGDLPADLRDKVRNNEATIPSLTELLPPEVQRLLDDASIERIDVPTFALSLDAPAGSLHARVCRVVRGCLGTLRRMLVRLRSASGFALEPAAPHTVVELSGPPEHSLLREHLGGFHHQDTFVLALESETFEDASASVLLGNLLDSFVTHPPSGVTRLMALRNLVVKPLRLRTSPLGCPVSSLLGPSHGEDFLGRFPVLDQRIDFADTRAQVILGADDKHLRFRSCVAVRKTGRRRAELSLGTRVQCTRAFGHLYMGLIDRVHRGYISPAMLRAAAVHALAKRKQLSSSHGHPHAHDRRVDAKMTHD